ncbi:MAG: response regulator transcription factor [Bacteroidia bacterium]|nr:response regulator transcription factor [Bacteroidia bacterium]
MKARILIVEDEPSMRMGLTDNLGFDGYEVDAAADGEEGLKLALANTYDLIILDIMMPKLSGFDVCKQIRQQDNLTPILMLSAKGEEIDKVLGLELGADDYLSKPFGLRELLARVKAILRRSNNNVPSKSTSKEATIGRLKVDFMSFKAFQDDKEVKLSHKAFQLLEYLFENQNKVVSRDDLLKNVWDYDQMPTTRTVDNFIVKLRQVVENQPSSPSIILTVHGIGYKLIATHDNPLQRSTS